MIRNSLIENCERPRTPTGDNQVRGRDHVSTLDDRTLLDITGPATDKQVRYLKATLAPVVKKAGYVNPEVIRGVFRVVKRYTEAAV